MSYLIDHIQIWIRFTKAESDVSDTESDVPLAELQLLLGKRAETKNTGYNWAARDSMYGPSILPALKRNEVLNVDGQNPIDYFFSFFTIGILEEILYQTNLYATQKNK